MAEETAKVVVKGDTTDAQQKLKALGTEIKGVGESAKTTTETSTLGFGKMVAALAAAGIGISTVTEGLRLGHKEAADYARAMAVLTSELERLNLAQGKGYEREKLDRYAGQIEAATGVDDARILSLLSRQISAGVDPEQAKSRLLTALDVETALGMNAESFLEGVQGADAGFAMKLGRMAKQKLGLNTDGMTVNELVRITAAQTEGAAAKAYAAQGIGARASVRRGNFWQNQSALWGDLFSGEPFVAPTPEEDEYGALGQRSRYYALWPIVNAARVWNRSSTRAQKRSWTDAYNRRVPITASEEVMGDAAAAPKPMLPGQAPAAAAAPRLPGQAPAAAAALSVKIAAPQGTRATVTGATR